ncbi:recombinase family protein [Candidatus Daviesbacteria bacterium]|nr:recombinase family protein [Candidatus Daviesbacteria bacterium]
MSSLKKKLDEEGFRTQNGKPLTKSNYFIVLTNPIYYGMMRWNNELYPGIHQALIDQQLFDRVQGMLRRTKNGELIPVYAKHNVTYRGLLSCGECSCKITADEKTKTNKGNGFVHRWVYYHCTHFKPCAQRGAVREEKIEGDVISLLGGLKLGPNTVEWLKNKLKEDHQDEVEFRNNAISSLRQSLDRVIKRLDEVYDDKLDGVIDEATYFRKRKQFLTEREDIEKQIKSHGKADDIYKDFGCLVLDVAQRAGQIYKVRKPEEKQYLANFVFSNLSLMNKNLQFSFQLIFEAIKNYQKTKDELPDAGAVRISHSLDF